MNAITRPYTLKYPMLWHEPTLEGFSVGRRQHTSLHCECGWRCAVPLPPGRANQDLNRKYQDHLVEVMEARMR